MVRTRVAPSPTGNLHIGTAQSALYNWLFPRKNGGKFYLRIEDTDRERSTKEYEQNILDSMEWLGLGWDDKPTIQSSNLPRHKEILEKILKEDKAFYCHHTREELESERKEQETQKKAPIHICSHKNSPEGKKSGGIIRLKVNELSERIISFKDQIRGTVQFKEALLGDFSIARSVDDPLYHFVVVVDDADMGITHVLRGEDHISNTPKHILIYEALGLSVPTFAHLPLILAPDRSKLSKRNGNTSALSYKTDYLPEAVINFLGSLGYTFSKEIISKEEMIREFELENVHKSGAIFDVKKLNWINSQYIKKLPPEEFKKIANLPNLPDEAVPLVTERLEKLSDAQSFKYLWGAPEKVAESYGKEKLIWKKSKADTALHALKLLDKLDWENTDSEKLKSELDNLAEKEFGGDRGAIYWPLRIALTGEDKSPDPIEIYKVRGAHNTSVAIKEAIKKFE